MLNIDFSKSPRGYVDPVDILIVDDSPENLLSIESLLEDLDVNFIKATSGEAALEATLNYKPAVILLDVQMPGMDGFEVARILRSTHRTREIPIIFVTATQRDEKFSFKGFESGAVDYLLKPLNSVILKSKVRVFVELHKNRMHLERAVRDLQILNRELESFSFSVSHDLRAPLRSIIGFANEAIRESENAGGEPIKENLFRVIQASNRMNQLIEGLLNLSRVTRYEVRRLPVDLSAVASRICEELKKETGKAHVEIKITPRITVLGDPTLLENVIQNFLSNAFKFTQKVPQPEIEFGSKRINGETVYYVKDNGAGFEMKRAERLFTAFQRLHNERDYPGTGVGLATVQRIIHRHGGRVWAESLPNESTTFYFTLQ